MNLSVSVPEAVQIVLGSESKCSKTDWYETSLPLVNLHTTRDKKIHEKRRKVFSRAFSPQALRDYEPRINMHAEEFINQIKVMKGKPFRGDRWFKYFAYDVMGELAFGESFGMLTAEENRWVPDLLEAGMEDIGYLQPVPWATLLLHNIPFTAKGAKSFLNFVGNQVAKRSAKKGEKLKPDIFSYLLEDYEKSPKKDIDYQWLRGDTRLTIVGGSDTTASTLCYIFYYLAKDPSQIAKLRAELEPLLAGGKTHLEAKDVVNAKHLNGVIHEALRLNPPIPSGYPRLTPPEGIVINGTYIPGNTTVVVPLYTIGHSEAAYVRAEEFIPERWYSQPELMKFKNEAFASFSLGAFSSLLPLAAPLFFSHFIVVR
jgi:cytochrome P450